MFFYFHHYEMHVLAFALTSLDGVRVEASSPKLVRGVADAPQASLAASS